MNIKILAMIFAAAGMVVGISICRNAFSQSLPSTTDKLASPFYISNGSSMTWTEFQSITLNAWTIKAPKTLTLSKSKECRFVILEESDEKVVIGCRVELSK